MTGMDLNADLGESYGHWTLGDDERLVPHLTSANLACGFHAGDFRVMEATVALCRRAGVAVGAQPGYPDLLGFGRRPMSFEPDEVESLVRYQIGALEAFCRAQGVEMQHVKPHGALYNQAAEDETVARAIVRGVARAGRDLILVGLASTEPMRRAARAEGLRFAAEAFADRRYTPAGTLQSRHEPGSVLTDPAAAAAQAVKIATEGRVIATDGSEIALQADTLCLHGDNPAAVANAAAVRRALESAGVAVQPLAV
jgi:5-oxoprolinase (ATP-hydrolysing) subunit A